MLPPYAITLGIVRGDIAGEDPALLTMPSADTLLGRPGYLHGGAIGGLLEMAAIVALRHALAQDAKGSASGEIKPINVTVDYMRGGREKPTFARGTVTRLGGRVANVEAKAWQDDPTKPIAAARMNYLIVRQ